jgi:hypothetical protein
VEVLEDTESAQANFADEGKPRCIWPSFFLIWYTIIYGCLCI